MSDARTHSVYVGRLHGEIVYVGTTIQRPEDRFRWHKHNGKPLDFEVVAQYDNADDMLDEEHRLIAKHKPKLNKRTRRQNLNRKLTPEQLGARKGDGEWCQGCLKRRVNPGYAMCFRCSRGQS